MLREDDSRKQLFIATLVQGMFAVLVHVMLLHVCLQSCVWLQVLARKEWACAREGELPFTFGSTKQKRRKTFAFSPQKVSKVRASARESVRVCDWEHPRLRRRIQMFAVVDGCPLPSSSGSVARTRVGRTGLR